MKGCMGCFGMLMVLAAISLVIQGVIFVWVTFWPVMLGLSLSWAALRYYKAISSPRYEEID